MVTTYSPGTGHRLALLDLGSCYPAGTPVYFACDIYVSANWPGNYKTFQQWLVIGYSLADLAANEAIIDAGAGVPGTHYIWGGGYPGYFTTGCDCAAGDNSINHQTNMGSDYTFPSAKRYVSMFVKPSFTAVPWYTNDLSTLTLGGAALGGASPTSCPVDSPVADFSASPSIAEVGDTITFTDLSTNTPTSWAWTFGDGGTSTSQNPTHVYATAGMYSVTLIATNSDGSDSETKSAYVSVLVAGTPDPPEPAGVLLEIYAADPGSARWDVAQWDVDSWGRAGWQDVTPYGVTVDIDWGASRPELGILSTPDAASWAVDYYDPDRILDPANADGPYFGDLIPFLPIRVSHRGTVVRRGYASGIAHYYAKGARHGYMRGADNISILANAQVPSDTTLPNTLYARAVAAISAAGLSVTVAAPIGTDPAVTPWVTGTREWSVWQWISDAAQEVLHIPIVDRLGIVTFRAWAAPLARGRVLGSPELIDLQAVTDYSGLFSVIEAREDEDTVIERRITPPPRYGHRTYTRNEDTLDPDAWAEAVLADRAGPTLLWKPGDVRPLTAVSTEMLATIEAVERVGIEYPEASPSIFASGIIVGGHISIVGLNPDEAVWRFHYELASTPTEPLIETGGAPTDYLLRTGGGEFLYPTGAA